MIEILAKITKSGELKIHKFFKEDFKRLYGQDILIKKQDDSRTSQQNRYLWGICYKIIGDELGYTSEEVHEVMKNHFLSYLKNGYKFTRSTTELTIGEFADYTRKVKDYALQELNILIPDEDI